MLVPALAQNGNFSIALPGHSRQLAWQADGFKTVQASAKPNGREFGIWGENKSSGLHFLGFLFLFPELAPLTSAKCREGVMEPLKKSTPGVEVLGTSESVNPDGTSIAVARYVTKARNGSTAYAVRGFVAAGDICGDLEFYSSKEIGAENADIK